MAGKIGFEHHCTGEKVSKIENKKSLKDSLFSHAQIDMIWDFYVTHAICGGSGLERSVIDYGWTKDDKKSSGYPAIEKALFDIADLSRKICFIRAKTCKDTLTAMDLSEDLICVNHERAVLLQNYNISIDENDTIQFSGGGENHVNCLFRHIRNALAHGNTYFFDNGMVLLEDKDNSKITASILIKQQSLLDWIRVIDKEEKFYVLIDVCAKCKTEESLK